jgi:hypothetical protein
MGQSCQWGEDVVPIMAFLEICGFRIVHIFWLVDMAKLEAITVASENVYTSATKKISTAQQSPKSTQLNHA